MVSADGLHDNWSPLKEYFSKKNYDKHVKICMIYNCDDCDKTFQTNDTLAEHRRKYHSSVNVSIY